ncbi:12474_t:CDS:1 [Racocetra fulgida]|uniref:12474_t:CDS:1 n=1 Tax=Racocetra fulgida TaxID=60492 RepID=A0A9N9FS37_9GLOM|nr:12474_t:CDS:1 [Racocetra fulgida]
MYVNTLPVRIRNGHKFPIPLENESYYHRHQPVEFSIKFKSPPMVQSATGMIFLTDKRIIFIAYEPSSDGFENFYVMLADVVSSVKQKKSFFDFNSYFQHNTIALEMTLRDKTSFNMSITYDDEDSEQKGIFEDYYGMLLSWATKTKPEKIVGGRPLSITTLTSFVSDDRPDSAYFSTWSTNPFRDGEKPPAYS